MKTIQYRGRQLYLEPVWYMGYPELRWVSTPCLKDTEEGDCYVFEVDEAGSTYGKPSRNPYAIVIENSFPATKHLYRIVLHGYLRRFPNMCAASGMDEDEAKIEFHSRWTGADIVACELIATAIVDVES